MTARFVKLRTAAELVGKTPGALAVWINRYNRNNPTAPIRRIWGAVNEDDLEKAIANEVERRTPAVRIARALVESEMERPR